MNKKTGHLHVKIPQELKEAFFEAAKKNAQLPSKLVRKWIEGYAKGEMK